MDLVDDENFDGGLVPKFGAIFMSNTATKRECFKRNLFGLPMAMANFVKQVKSGMILFLFEFEKRELYGVFRATSDGTMNLIPHAFTSSGKQFPAQVQVAPIWSCSPLPEVVFQDALRDNYYSPKKFHFGLSENQVRVLLQLFYSRRLDYRSPQRQIADELTREAGNKRKRIVDRNMVTGTFGQETSDYIDSPFSKKSPENIFDRAERVGDDGLSTGDRLEQCRVNSSLRHSMDISSPDVHLTKKIKINNNCFMNRDASESALLKSDPRNAQNEHGMHNDIIPVISDKRPSDDSRFPGSNRFSSEHIGNSLGEMVGADREPLMIGDRFVIDYNSGDCIIPNILPVFVKPTDKRPSDDSRFPGSNRFSSEHIGNSLGGMVGADREPLMIGDRFVIDYNSGDSIIPNILPVFPRYSAVSDDNIRPDDCRFSKEDMVENSCDVESCIKPDFSSGVAEGFCKSESTDPYDPEFPYIDSGCSSNLLDSAPDHSSRQVPDENVPPLSISTGGRASLYSESVKPSVFSRLSVIPMVRDESVTEIMAMLRQSHKHWAKGKKPVVSEEMEIDVDHCTEENIVLKETRVVDFKRRSEKKKNLDGMVTTVSKGTSMCMASKTSGDAISGVLLGKVGKSRKLIRPDFSTKEEPDSTVSCGSKCVDSTTCKDASKSCGISDAPAKNTWSNASEDNNLSKDTIECKVSTNSKKICGATSVHQEDFVGKELSQDIKNLNQISPVLRNERNLNVKNALEIENQVKMSIQDLVSSLTSKSSAQDSLSDVTEVTIPEKLESKEKNEVTNPQGSSGANNLDETCSLKDSLKIENQVELSIQDHVNSLTSGSSPLVSSEVIHVLENLEGKEQNADLNHQVDGEVDNL